MKNSVVLHTRPCTVIIAIIITLFEKKSIRHFHSKSCGLIFNTFDTFIDRGPSKLTEAAGVDDMLDLGWCIEFAENMRESVDRYGKKFEPLTSKKHAI